MCHSFAANTIFWMIIPKPQHVSLQSIAALLRPLGACAEFLNPEMVKRVLTDGIERSKLYVQELEEKDFKEKVSVSWHMIHVCIVLCVLVSLFFS